jgi:hypothetical protein
VIAGLVGMELRGAEARATTSTTDAWDLVEHRLQGTRWCE